MGGNMTTGEAYLQNRESLVQALQNAKTIKEGMTAIQMAFERTAAVLAQNEENELDRQRAQAVIAVAKQAPMFLKGIRAEGQLIAKQPEETEAGQKLGKGAMLQIAGAGIMAVLAVYEGISGKWTFALLAVIAVLLMFLGSKEKQPEERMYRAEGKAVLDAEEILRSMEEICRCIDRAVTDLALIDREETGKAMEIQEDALLDLMSTLMEARESGREDLALESLGEAEQTLRRLGIEAIRYSAERRDLFDVLPTLGDSRTVRPALISGDKVLRRGVAAVKTREVTM